MQYLSKAYSYYSGINPATLSGAIDVIVVKSIDSDGNVQLSSSPFHVRFGKLQVLRAGEKRVTMKLPNNLPAPHIAPFSMKVGESGEAFFVFETDGEVPPDLLTSPIVAPTEPGDNVANEPGQTKPVDQVHPHTLTKTPFGETERNANGDLADVEYFDLNGETKASVPTESSEEHGGKSLSVPPSSTRSLRFAADTDYPHYGDAQPPNPLRAHPGEPSGLPSRDHKLENMALAGSSNEESLPRVTAGQGEGPDVIYGEDVVFDMGGYHQSDQETEALGSESYDTFLQDVIKATKDRRPVLKPSRATDTVLASESHTVTQITASASSTPDLSADISSLDIESDDEEEIPDRRYRGQSEPPFQQTHEPLIGRSPPSSPPRSPRHFANSVGLGTAVSHAAMDRAWDWTQAAPNGDGTIGCFRIVEDNPYLFVFDAGQGRKHTFELALGNPSNGQEELDIPRRISLQAFLTEPSLIDDPRTTVRYDGRQWDRNTGGDLLQALSALRKTLMPPAGQTSSIDDSNLPAGSSSWSRWWRKSSPAPTSAAPLPLSAPSDSSETFSETVVAESPPEKVFAKTLRLTSEQLQQLNLKPGPNTVQFSVTSSYSGFATCSARVFLWEETDQIVISDIDGTITKSDALGHVFAAIGRDWTHLGIAKLYTDISNNGYRMLYLTSRAIGQADSTREYLRSINQGNYRMPEGPVIMSPDRLMASLHREVIMRKPELFKMACLRDIQRLFSSYAKEAFFAGFGNRITDAMSYRSVGIDASKIYTIDSTGVVKTELLQAAGHKGSYFLLNDLVNEVFPPVHTKFKPEFTDFSYWRSSIAEVALPDLSPPSPALSARSDTSRSSTGMLSKIATLGRRSSKPLLPISQPSSRPSSPLMGPALTADDLSDLEDEGRNSGSSMPGSYEDRKGSFFPQDMHRDEPEAERDLEEGLESRQDSFDDSTLFDDDLLATGEMQHVPF